MADEIGSFRIDIELENPARPGTPRAVRSVLVDTGAELSCDSVYRTDGPGIPHKSCPRVTGSCTLWGPRSGINKLPHNVPALRSRRHGE